MLADDVFSKVTNYQIDSRMVRPGSLFFAVRGKTVDGHAFVPLARRAGAVGAVVEEGYSGPEEEGFFLLRVPSVLEALRELARHSLKGKRPKLIGVTGSVGKTTTKEFLAALLSRRFKVGKTERSYNSKWTVPLAFLNRRGDEEVFVLEMGMSEPSDLVDQVALLPPDLAILTKVGLAHAAFFPGGLADIARGKGEIFRSPETKVALYHQSVAKWPEALAKAQGVRLSYSLDDSRADFYLSPEGHIDEKGVRGASFKMPFAARHLQENLLGAIGAARTLGLSWGEIEEGISLLPPLEMRFSPVEKGGVLFINDAYNANPESVLAALANLPAPAPQGRKAAVLGSMLELGSFSESAHLQVGEAALSSLDALFLLGEETRPVEALWKERGRAVEWFSDREALAQKVGSFLRAGDVLLCKGSRSLQIESILEKILEHAPFPP